MLQLSTVVVIVVVRRSRGNKKFATQLTRLRNISEAIRWRDYINCYQRFAKSIFHYLHSDEATDKLVFFSRSWLRIIAKVIEWKTFSRSTFIFTSNVNRSFARWNFEIPFALWPGPRWLRRKWVRPFFLDLPFVLERCRSWNQSNICTRRISEWISVKNVLRNNEKLEDEERDSCWCAPNAHR